MRKLLMISMLLVHQVSLARPTVLVLKNVSLVDVKNGQVTSNRNVYIQGNTIHKITRQGKLPWQATVAEARGKYLIPGLWDMHMHTLQEERIETNFPLFIANGVTGIRDMAMPLANLILLKQWRGEY